MKKNHSSLFLAIGLILCSLFYSCKNASKSNELVILYDLEFDDVKKIAKKERKSFVMVLARPDCPPCEHYVQNLSKIYEDFGAKIIFNIVDISLPENQWYMHWLCSGASPTNVIFSQKGELKAIVSGVTKDAVQCIKTTFPGENKCSNYFYGKYFSTKDDVLQMLNALLTIKQNLDKGKDIGEDINALLNQSNHPYLLYLNSLNNVNLGQDEEAVFWASEFLTEVNYNSYHTQVYSNLFPEVRMIINPNYSADEEGELSVVANLDLGHFNLRESRPFNLSLTNTGKTPLHIHDVRLSCSCVKLQGERKLTLQPGESKKLDFVYTADIAGDVLREITFFSNGVNPMQTVRITAKVK
jgi:thiol-disulfide isomerase/thioredoxin